MYNPKNFLGLIWSLALWFTYTEADIDPAAAYELRNYWLQSPTKLLPPTSPKAGALV